MYSDCCNSVQVTPERFQVLPSLSYHIRKLLRGNLHPFQLPSDLEQVVDPLHDLDATLAFLYPDVHQMNTVVLQLERLILSYQSIRIYGSGEHPALKVIEQEVFWWLGYENRSATCTVLIVDDVLENTKLIANILKPLGYKVYTALNGAVALNLLQEIQPDLIFLDVRMPIMDGYQLFQVLQQTERLRSIPVIFLSALDNVEEQQKAIELGAVSFMAKPFKAASVLEQVQRHLNHQLSITGVDQSQMQARRDRASHIPCLLCDATKAGFQATLDGRYLRVSSALAQICGYSTTTAMLSEVKNLWEGIYRNPLHRVDWQQCITHPNQMVQFDSQIYRQDGHILRVVEQVQAIQDNYDHFLLYEGFITIKEAL